MRRIRNKRFVAAYIHPREIAETEEEEDAKRYNTIDEIPTWAKDTVRKLIDKGLLKGGDDGLDLSVDMLRLLVVNDRAGLYG